MATALQALERIIDYNIQRKRSDVQESLSFMQFAIQKRQADIATYKTQMETLKSTNDIARTKVANNFINQSGLQGILALVPTEIGEQSEKQLTKLTEKLQEKKYGDFNKNNAIKTANALFMYKTTKDSRHILNYANDVNSTLDKKAQFESLKKGDKDKKITVNTNLIYSLQRLAGDNLKDLSNTLDLSRKVEQNSQNILKEQFQFAEDRDTRIQSDFNLFNKEDALEFVQGKQPSSEEEKTLTRLQGILGEQEDRDEEESEMEIPTGAIKGVGVGVLGGAALGKEFTSRQFQEAEKIFNKNLKQAIKRKVAGDINTMSKQEFGEKYKYRNTEGKLIRPSKRFAESKAGRELFERMAKDYAREQTTAYKTGQKVKSAANWVKELSFPKLGVPGGYTRGVGLAATPVVLPYLGRKAGGLFGDEEAELKGAVGGTAVSSFILANKPVRAGGRTFLNYLGSKIPRVASKLAATALVDSPVVGIADLVGFSIAVADIIAIYKEWQDLYGEAK